MNLDDLDKKILRHLSEGTCSYEELARNCNVTRNTVYRRIASLEKSGIIKNTLRCIVDFDKLDVTSMVIGAKVPYIDLEKTLNLLATHRNVRLLLRSYGDHNVSLVAFCFKGKEGEVIQSINSILEEVNATNVSVSVGFSWEKMDLTTFDDQIVAEPKIEIIKKQAIPAF
jgi:DNA-binding Lrp family transcriptional regulator